MSEYDFSNDSMLEMYLFESTTLLDQLDGILLLSEKSGHLSPESINEIFRIMHTIKGSSAMMEFNIVSFVAHKLEDLFYVIRENGIKDAYFSGLFDLVLNVSDFLKEEVEKIQQNRQLCTENDLLVSDIMAFLEKLKSGDEEDDAIEATEGEDPETEEIFESDELDEDTVDAKMPPHDEVLAEEAANVPDPAELPSETVPSEESAQILNLHIMFTPDCQMENIRAFMLLNILQPFGQIIATVPGELNNNSDASGLIAANGFFCKIATGSSREEIVDAVKGTLSVKSCGFTSKFPSDEAAGPIAEASSAPESKKSAAAEKPSLKAPEVKKTAKSAKGESAFDTGAAAQPSQVTAASASAAASQAQSSDDSGDGQQKKAGKQNLINVDLNKLDTLMDLVGEIVITESMVSSNPDLAGLELESFHKSSRQLRKLTDELQGIVMSIRMVPISSTFQKMHRIVRDMNKKLNKEVELVLIGETTEVDKTIIDGIADPLMHLVRNAMDHGLEDRNARVAAGKDPTGRIILSAQNNGGDIIISVSDNGKGLDPEVILAKAKASGILTKSPGDMTEKEIFNLLTMPGFSTKEAVTEFSGRGVGMDVVKKNIEKIGGTVTIESVKGAGTNVFFKIPLTLAIIAGMEITAGGNIYTLPISNIRESFKAKADQLISDPDKNEMIMIRGVCYPIIRLHKVFNIDNCVENIEDGILLLVDSGERLACVFADGLLGKHQVVVKALPAFLNRYPIKYSGIAGCTILGDGGISLILDAQGVLNRF